jgi:hypothetical protein
MVIAALLWLAAAATAGMLFVRNLQNPGLLGLAGSVLALLFHYGIATIPEISYLAVVLWLGAAALLASRFLSQRRRRTA